jgi:hypothetical protein
LRDFLLEGPIEVTHALDERITALVGFADYRPGVAPQNAAELADGINKAIESGEVLWKLHGTVVLGLGATVVVKIGTSLDPDEVANLLYINGKVPAVPAPLCLGCLTTKQRTYVFHVTVRRCHAQVAVAGSLRRAQGIGKTTARQHIPCIA